MIIITIKSLPKNHDHINHFDLRSCVESMEAEETFIPLGRTTVEPESWTMQRVNSKQDDILEEFTYDCKAEYTKDYNILSGNFETTITESKEFLGLQQLSKVLELLDMYGIDTKSMSFQESVNIQIDIQKIINKIPKKKCHTKST